MAAIPEELRCAATARSRGDALAGTAPRGTYWILIEHRGGWPVNGFDGLDLDWRVHSEVFCAAQALRARILLVRRHGKRTREGPGAWAVMHLGGLGRLRQIWGTWSRDADLLDICQALRQCAKAPPDAQSSEAEAKRSDAGPQAQQDPLILVCAHGQHDVCCAVRGRPAAEALSRRWPDAVWECTHVGGDRFAANILVVPDGVYYGNLDADSAVTVIEGHLSGRIGAEHLRGYTDLAPVEQTAVAAALEHNGPAGRFDYTVSESRVDDGLWTVHVRGRLPEQTDLEVELGLTRSQPQYLTCRGVEKASAVTVTVRSVRPDPLAEIAPTTATKES